MADLIRIGVDLSSLIRARRELEQKSIRFAAASTLTAVAKDAQAEVQRNVRKAFTLRNTWTEQGIKIKSATPNNLEATIYTDTSNRRTGAPDYLVRQQDGGEKIPFRGGSYIAVPTKYLRMLAPRIIPDELRPRNLLGAVQGRYTATNRRTKQIALRNQQILRGFVFFVQRLRNGTLAIMGRNALEVTRDAYPFYFLKDEVQVKKSGLQFYETIQKVVGERLVKHWDEAWSRIYAKGIRL